MDTAYWQVLQASHQAQRPRQSAIHGTIHQAQKSDSGSSYAFWLDGLGHECFHAIANSRLRQLTAAGKSGRELFGSGVWAHWQLVSRLPIVGQFLYRKSSMVKIFTKQILDFGPDVLLVMNPNLLPKSLGQVFSRAGIAMVGQIASPLPPLDYFKPYDLMLSAHPGQVRLFETIGVKSKFLALNIEDSLVPVSTPPLVGRGHDITFVGSFGRHHKKSLDLISEVSKNFPSLSIFTVSSLKRLRRLGLGKHFAGQAWGKRMMDIYSDSKIVLNRHIDMANGYAVNFRMFEATAAGAILLTESAPNLPELFEPEAEAITYSSPSEAVAKIRLILESIVDFQIVADSGRRRLQRDHLASSRVRELERILLEVVASKPSKEESV